MHYCFFLAICQYFYISFHVIKCNFLQLKHIIVAKLIYISYICLYERQSITLWVNMIFSAAIQDRMLIFCEDYICYKNILMYYVKHGGKVSYFFLFTIFISFFMIPKHLLIYISHCPFVFVLRYS